MSKDGTIEIAFALVVDAEGDNECFSVKVSNYRNLDEALADVANEAAERFDNNVGGSYAKRIIRGVVRLPVPTHTAQTFTIVVPAQKPDEGAEVSLS